MSEKGPPPRPDTIMRHSTSLYSSIAFFIGTQLDVFTILDEGPMTAKEVAAALETRPHFAERLLNALVAAEVVEIDGEKFSNTPESSHYLVKGKPSYLGEHVTVSPYLKYWMFEAGIKTAETFRKGEAVDSFDYEGLPFDALLGTFRGTMPVAVKAGEELARRFDFSRYATVADVGGASGGLIASLAKAYPDVRYTVTDLPSVTPVAEALLKEQGMTDVDVVEWNVLEGPCGRKFDVVILRALVQVFSPEHAREAVKNIGASVNTGGSIFVLGHVMDDSKTSPVEEVGWYLINLNWEDKAGYYAEEDMIGITGTNARPAVAPTHGVENMLGTNPLTFAFPTDEGFPFLMDAATSITQRGKIEAKARRGETVPEGLVIDRDGAPMTDPDEILGALVRGEASLLPVGGSDEETGGHKGYGYSTVVEVLSSALQGGAFLRAVTGVNVGHFFMAVDISAFTEPEEFKRTAGDIMRSLRSSRRMPGRERIYTPGEKEHLARLERKGIPINESLRAELAQMRDELGLKGYGFL